MNVHCHLAELLDARDLTIAELSKRVGITPVNLSKLKNNRAKAVRFSTLLVLCKELECQPGDLFTVSGGRIDAGGGAGNFVCAD
ncbi:helix-turn-helix domain-containing protein [Corynebacterium alimapuense]|uniref:Transcriptional regulator n=1 Tax=Corynebacterium alimapuense TaxID=1576874 RepID=A0A3M8K968_9CORY|nr:helix-turn-helix transcriptional regulator [Corynebacterium alimapuense]RNE49429.1 transcriptional regulator [Corynebacterium alimapuense]